MLPIGWRREQFLQMLIAVSAQDAATNWLVAVAQVEAACGGIGLVHIQANALFASGTGVGRQGIQQCCTDTASAPGGDDGDRIEIPLVGITFSVGEKMQRRIEAVLLQGNSKRQVNLRSSSPG